MTETSASDWPEEATDVDLVEYFTIAAGLRPDKFPSERRKVEEFRRRLQETIRAALRQPAQPADGAQAGPTLEGFIADLMHFQLDTFGPMQTIAGVLDHITKELEQEIRPDPTDNKEWLGLMNLSVSAQRINGATPSEVASGWMRLLDELKARKWPDWRDADPDKAIEHHRATPAAPAQVGAQPSELERLRNEVASLRASLGQSVDRPAEPIGCSTPGACSCPSAQPAPDMVQRHEKQLADWVDAHPVFGPAHRAYEASKAAQSAGRVENFIYEDVIANRRGEGTHRFVPEDGPGAQPAGRVEANPLGLCECCEEAPGRHLSEDDGWLCGECSDQMAEERATPPTAGAVDDGENGR